MEKFFFSFFKQKEIHLPWPKKLKAPLGVLLCGCSVHSPDSVSCGPEVSMRSCYCSHIVSQLPSATPLTLRCVIPASFCPSVGSLSLQDWLLYTLPPALPLGTLGVGNERDYTPSHVLAQEEGVADLGLVRKRTLRFSDLHCIQRNWSFSSVKDRGIPFVAGSCFILVHA